MTSWRDLKAELDLWADGGRRAEFWWRDDDASRPEAALERLLSVAASHETPVALAVIPQRAEPELAEYLRDAPQVEVLQHGLGHINHAPPDKKKQEFGPHRSPKSMLADVLEGARHLAPFGNRCAVFVPPWNRIDAKLLPVLPALGLRGISTFGPRGADDTAPGLCRVNTHIDPVNWRGGRGYAGDRAVLGQIIRHLEHKRSGLADADEPTGLLTHHLVHDEACWSFITRLLDLTCSHEAVKWRSASQSFGFDK